MKTKKISGFTGKVTARDPKMRYQIELEVRTKEEWKLNTLMCHIRQALQDDSVELVRLKVVGFAEEIEVEDV